MKRSRGEDRPWRGRLAVPPRALLLAFLAAACAAPPGEQAAGAMQDALASHQASLAGLGDPAAVQPLDETRLAAVAVAPVAPAPGGLPDAATPPMAGGLVGQTPATLRQWLGEPRLRRVEGPAEIWHYQASQCNLDLVLYPDEAPSPVLRVAFAAARAAGTARRGETACLRDIARGATRPGPPGIAGMAAGA